MWIVIRMLVQSCIAVKERSTLYSVVGWFFHLFNFFSLLFYILQHSLSINLVTSLAANNYQLQNELIRNGVLWSLLLFMFDYDYTLEESGVEIEEKSNKQVRGPKICYCEIWNSSHPVRRETTTTLEKSPELWALHHIRQTIVVCDYRRPQVSLILILRLTTTPQSQWYERCLSFLTGEWIVADLHRPLGMM